MRTPVVAKTRNWRKGRAPSWSGKVSRISRAKAARCGRRQRIADRQSAEAGPAAGADAQRVEARLPGGEFGANIVAEDRRLPELDLGETAPGLRIVEAGDLADNTAGQ